MSRLLKILSVLFFVPIIVQAAAPKKSEALNVLVTLKPLYSLTVSLMKGAGKPHLLLEGSEDPHHFSLAPSHVKLLKEADLVIWVGSMLEGFLTKSIRVHKKRRVTLMSTVGLKLLHRENAHGCLLEEACVGEEKAKKKNDTKNYDTQHTAIDPHIWLDIDNTILIVREITSHLIAIDLKNAKIYHDNSKELIKKLEDFKIEIDKKAQALAHFHFISFHDAYGYLEHRYKVKNSAAEIVKGHEKLSLKAFSEIRHLIKKRNIRCILVDIQHPSDIEQKLSREFNMSMYEADPLGIDIEAGPDHYFTLMRTLIQQLDDCRKTQGSKK